MKISLESRTDINEIVSYDKHHIVIKHYAHTELETVNKSFILTPKQLISNKRLSTSHNDDITFIETLKPEVMIISQMIAYDIPPTFIAHFAEKSIGIEAMPIGPACRTYNLLAAEGRHIVLILDFD